MIYDILGAANLKRCGRSKGTDEFKRFQADVRSNPELAEKLDQLLTDMPGDSSIANDGDALVRAAAKLGYTFKASDLDRAAAEEQKLDLDEMQRIAGGKENSDKGECQTNYLCNFTYGSKWEDEMGHDSICAVVWHCATAFLHTECKDTEVFCWSDFTCIKWNH